MLAHSFLIKLSSKLLVIRTGIKGLDEFDFIQIWNYSLWSCLPLTDYNSTLLNLNISEGSWQILINFKCNIIGEGERLHKSLGQIGWKRWFFDPILFIYAGNKDMHEILDEFEFWLDLTTVYGVSCLEHLKKFHRLVMGKLVHSFFMESLSSVMGKLVHSFFM